MTLFDLFGVNEVSKSIINKFYEIRTGEGKSLILGIASCIFALLGYRVNTVSYSEYLSDRDYKDFERLFIDLDVNKFIKYGTIINLTKDLINSKGNIP